ncbi:hypothetical protein PUNSTDRAFT_56215, partial [Punctularia strigosozonata HHB-11173 SS5]
TEILIVTFLTCPIHGNWDLDEPAPPSKQDLDPRANIAIARMNWLHDRYNIAGFVFWSEIGRRMGIHSIPATLDELRAWSEDYEARAMVPADSNLVVVEVTMGELQRQMHVSKPLRPFAHRLVITVLNEHTRIAMMQPAQPWYLHLITKAVLNGAMLFQRYVFLPRIYPLPLVPLEVPDVKHDEVARMHPTRWASKPWYKPQRSGLAGFMDWLLVCLHLVDAEHFTPAEKYKKEVYQLHEIGPLSLEKVGHEEVMRRAGDMLGCPIPAIWAAGSWGKRSQTVAAC